MKLSREGIGWLIFGILVCMSSVETGDIAGTIGNLAIGLVFIAVYFIKQKFDPFGIGWFIAGGILLAFCLEQLVGIMCGIITRFSILPGDLSDMLIGFIVAVICLYVFYRKNKDELEDVAYAIGDMDDHEPPYEEEIIQEIKVEETRQTVTTDSVAAPDTTAEQDDFDSILEFEILDEE